MQIIQKYFPELSEIQLDRFHKLYEIYFEWNNKINVVSRKDFENFYEHHVLHSLAIAKFVDFKNGAFVLDIGTGGGFPTIPLAILFPDVHFLASDSIAKKIKVVDAVVEALDLKNVETFVGRSETISKQFDFIITRAVAPLFDIITWSKNKIHPIAFHDIDNGIIALKGGDLKNEIRESKRKVVLKSISDYFEEPFFETKYITFVPYKN
jgi:16S rRNA (guanine527-N7)-methyltransferase